MRTPYNLCRSIHEERSGKPWTAEEEARLCELFDTNRPIEEIHKELQRKPKAIAERLSKLKRLVCETSAVSYDKTYFKVNKMTEFKAPATSSVNVTVTKTVSIGGRSADGISDVGILEEILKLEQLIKRLETITSKPATLEKVLKRCQEDIDALVTYLDERNATKP